MSIRETVGSLVESHRAKGSHPDRRNFIPQTDRLPSVAHFPLPQLRSTVPNSPTSVPNFQTTIPIFQTTFPNAKATVPIFRKAVPNESAYVPNFSAIFPIASAIFPNFPATFPNFSPVNLISKRLFPSHLRSYCRAKTAKDAKEAIFSRWGERCGRLP